MTFNIQLLSSTSWIPTRATSGSAGYDLHSPAEATIRGLNNFMARIRGTSRQKVTR